MKATDILSDFGKEFINKVRDCTLSDFEMIVTGKMKSEEALSLHKKIMSLSPENMVILKEVVKNIIDRELFNILNFFEQSDEYLISHIDNDTYINLNELSDGLAGELYSDNGWIAKYSEFKDL